jgi:hypothetical protein
MMELEELEQENLDESLLPRATLPQPPSQATQKLTEDEELRQLEMMMSGSTPLPPTTNCASAATPTSYPKSERETTPIPRCVVQKKPYNDQSNALECDERTHQDSKGERQFLH